MLRRFKVSNFKCFKEDFSFDLASAKAYTFNPEATKDDILDWFEDNYRDDSPIDKNYDGSYVLTKTTGTGYVNYILKFV